MKKQYQQLKKYLLGEKYAHNEQAHLFINACLIISAFSLLFYFISVLIGFKEGKQILLSNFLSYIILLFLLKSRIHLYFLTQMMIILASFTVVALIVFDGGLYSNVIPWLAGIPTASLLITNKKSSFFWLLVVLFLVFLFAFLDIQGVKFLRTHNPTWYPISQSLIVMGLILLIYSFNIIFERARNRANLFLNEKNKELQQQRLESLKQAEELRELNQLKTQILSAISHDFRSPLVSIKSVLSVLDDKLLSSEDFESMQKELTHRLDITLDSMDNLLQWSRSQIGQDSQASKTSFPIKKAIESSTRLLKDMMKHKKITLERSIHSDVEVSADFEQIQIVFRNLVSNAIKFSYEGSKIYIHVHKADKHVKIGIKDEGIGMTQEQLESLFVLGKHKSTFGTKNEKGTGLGLLLIKDYIEKNDGDFEIRSEQGKGSEFIFTLPLSVS